MKSPNFQSETFHRYKRHKDKEKEEAHKPNLFLNIRKFFRNLHRAVPFKGTTGKSKKNNNTESEIRLVKGKGNETKNDVLWSFSSMHATSGSKSSVQNELVTLENKRKPRSELRYKNVRNLETLFLEKGYRLLHSIGSGSYSKVRLVSKIADGRDYAAKIVDRSRYKNYAKKFLPKELITGLQMNHSNLIQYREVIIFKELTIMIMDHAQLGDLLEFIQINGALQNHEAKKIFAQITMAVQYLHEIGFAHRDLKCENILLKADKTPLISDFGFARRISQDGGSTTASETYCGSAAYASPELLCGIPYDPILNDIWSLGCILYIIVCESMPFDETDVKRMVAKQMAHSIHVPHFIAESVDEDCLQLIREILNPKPSQRPRSVDILESEWLKPIHSTLTNGISYSKRSISSLLG